MKVKSESEVAQLYLIPSDPMDCRPPGSCVHGIFQARVLEWGAIAFSNGCPYVTRVYVPRFVVSSQQRFGATDIKALGASQLSGLGQTVLQLLGKSVLQLYFI